MKKIGILGGAFNPPHLGHLIIAEQVKDQLALDEIWFIPTYLSPHKDQAGISVEDRIKMLRKSIDSNQDFSINLIEIKREGISYTIDTIKSLREEHPGHKFYFIIGADMVEYLPKWKNIDELIKLVTFVGVKRLNYQLKSPYPVKVIDLPRIEISSSYIRNKIKQNKSIKYLVKDSVKKFIEENGLYEN